MVRSNVAAVVDRGERLGESPRAEDVSGVLGWNVTVGGIGDVTSLGEVCGDAYIADKGEAAGDGGEAAPGSRWNVDTRLPLLDELARAPTCEEEDEPA